MQTDELHVTGKKSWEMLPFMVSQRQRTIWDLCFGHEHVLASSGKRMETAFDLNSRDRYVLHTTTIIPQHHLTRQKPEACYPQRFKGIQPVPEGHYNW